MAQDDPSPGKAVVVAVRTTATASGTRCSCRFRGPCRSCRGGLAAGYLGLLAAVIGVLLTLAVTAWPAPRSWAAVPERTPEPVPGRAFAAPRTHGSRAAHREHTDRALTGGYAGLAGNRAGEGRSHPGRGADEAELLAAAVPAVRPEHARHLARPGRPARPATPRMPHHHAAGAVDDPPTDPDQDPVILPDVDPGADPDDGRYDPRYDAPDREQRAPDDDLVPHRPHQRREPPADGAARTGRQPHDPAAVTGRHHRPAREHGAPGGPGADALEGRVVRPAPAEPQPALPGPTAPPRPREPVPGGGAAEPRTAAPESGTATAEGRAEAALPRRRPVSLLPFGTGLALLGLGIGAMALRLRRP
ncbi:protein of unknown function [Streptantibioticus cattleyicolor NRRL 8057 = DSM 46488]|nr:protein of unknown function [Streptantibioticus cattleyicolor NRRL 8057 = DSM 46488]